MSEEQKKKPNKILWTITDKYKIYTLFGVKR